MKKVIVFLLVFSAFKNSYGQCLIRAIVFKEETLTVVKYPLARNSLFLGDSLITWLNTVQSGKFCFLDDSCRIRSIVTVKDHKISDTIVHYNPQGKLFGFSIYKESLLCNAYYYSSECRLGTYLEFPDPINRQIKTVFTYSDDGEVSQALFFDGPSLIRTETKRRKLRRMHRRTFFCGEQYYLPEQSLIIKLSAPK